MGTSIASELILDHRDAYHAESASVDKLSSERPPVLFDYEKAAWFEEPAAAIGLNLTAPMVRILGHPDGYGQAFPWRQALWGLRHECRKSHLGHTDRPKFEGALCQRLVYLVVVYDYSPGMAAMELQIDPTRSMRVLEEALRWIDRNLDQQREWSETEVKFTDHRSTETLADRFTREHDEDHERLAWQRLAAKGYALPEWEVERQRRLEYHQLYGCGRCKVDAA